MLKCELCHFNNPDGFAYCGRCGNGLAAAVPDDNSYANAIEGERKQVTIIFADISGFTALNDSAETPAQVERVLYVVNRCLDMLSDIVYEYDGYVDKYMGDAIMAVFGAPRSHEDDPERALHAALAMQEKLIEFNAHPPAPLIEKLGIHIGINTGTVIAGLVGTRRKRGYTVMGDAVNVASRLESVSERGEILVSQDTFYLTQQIFAFKNRDPVHVKGKREAMTVYELQGIRQQRATKRGIGGMRAPMVGRNAQFSALKNRIAALSENKGGIVVVTGEAGLGKSRLIAEVKQRTVTQESGIVWLEGRGLSYRQQQSYRLFIQILRGYLKVSTETPTDVVWQSLQTMGAKLFANRTDDIIPYLATLIGVKLDEKTAQTMPLSDPQLLQQRMFAAMSEWVETVATQHPLVLVFEDLHWADANSVRLVEYLMTLPAKLPLLLICITRPEKESDFWQSKTRAAKNFADHYTEIQLAPLTETQSRSLVDGLLQIEDLPPELDKLILSRAEGNPLFVEEVLRSLIEDGSIVKENEHWVVARPIVDIDIPDTLTGVLTARIDRLNEPEKRLLQIASVIGRVFSRTILQAVSDEVTDDEAEFDDYLQDLVEADLIRERDNGTEKTYIFKHILTYETTYNTLLIQQRRYHHKRIADHMAPMYYLRGEEYAGIIAHHYEQGEVWDRTLTYLLRAAEASKAAFDNLNAVEFYSKALGVSLLIDDLDPQIPPKIHEGRGRILRRLGKVEDARADFEQALSLAKTHQDLTPQMRILGELGNIYASHHKFSQAAPYFEQALNIARKSDNRLGLVDALNQLGEFKFNMGELSTASIYFHEALESAQSLKSTPRITSSEDGLAAVILYQGEVKASIERLEAIARTWRDIGNYQGLMKTYGWLATAYHWLAGYNESAKICKEATEIQQRTGDLNWSPTFSYCTGQNALAQGKLAQANQYFLKTTQSSQELANNIWQAMGLLGNSTIHALLGNTDIATRHAEEAITLADSTGSPLWVSRARRILGSIQRIDGHVTRAIATLENELGNMHRLGFAADQIEILNELLESYLSAEAWEKIETHTTRAIALIVPSNMKAHHARILRISADAAAHKGQNEHAITLLLQAKDIAKSTQNKLLEAEIELAMVSPFKALKRTPQATESLHRAEILLQNIAGNLTLASQRTDFLEKSPLAMRFQIAKKTVKG